MKQRIKKAVLNYGLSYLTENLFSRVPVIFMYHRFSKENEIGKVSKENFENQIRLISDKYEAISLDKLSDNINQGNITKSSVIITIDDGYSDFYDYAYPVLEKYNVPATIYITAGFVEREIWLWPDIIDYILQNSKKTSVSLNGDTVLDIRSGESKKYAWYQLFTWLSKLPDAEKWDELEELCRKLDVQYPETIPCQYSPLTWSQINNMDPSILTIGSHTYTHPILSNILDNQLEKEIYESKCLLEKKTGRIVNHFCYPNGTKYDYSPATKKHVINAGYKTATVSYHDSKVLNDTYELRRYSVSNDQLLFQEAITRYAFLLDLVRNYI